MGPWGQEPQSRGLAVKPKHGDSIGPCRCMGVEAMGPWRHGSMGAMQFEGHGGRHRARRPWGHGARSHKVGGWPSKPKHKTLDIAPGAMGPWRHGLGAVGARGPWSGWSGGRAEQAERAAGMHLKKIGSRGIGPQGPWGMGLGPWGQGWASTGALEVEKMGPWSHRGRRDGAMSGGRREGLSKRRAGMHWGPL